MEKLLILALFLSLALSKLQVVHPVSLKDSIGNSGYLHASLANFGHLPYGSTIMGRLHYPDQNRNGCSRFKDSDFRSDPLFDEVDDMNPVLLVDRGGCPFVNKIQNAQDYGVNMVVVADNVDEDSENLVMGSEAASTMISIPSYFISKKEGQKMKDALKEDPKAVYVKASLEMSHPDNRVEYEVFFSTVLDLEKGMIFDLGSHERAFGADALLIPRILTYSCKSQSCSQKVKDEDCVSDSRYCAYAPKLDFDNKFSKLKGSDMLLESLRSKCVYLTILNEQGEAGDFFPWYNYMVNFGSACEQEEDVTDCSAAQISNVGVDYAKVKDCVDKSFETPGIYLTENRILKEDQKRANNLGIAIHPSIVINNITYRGDISGYYVFKAICEGFKEKPKICKGSNIYKFMAESDQDHSKFFIRPANMRYRSILPKNGVQAFTVIVAVIFVVLFNVFLIYAYRKQHQKQLNEQLQAQVNSAVSQYFRLADQESMIR